MRHGEFQPRGAFEQQELKQTSLIRNPNSLFCFQFIVSKCFKSTQARHHNMKCLTFQLKFIQHERTTNQCVTMGPCWTMLDHDGPWGWEGRSCFSWLFKSFYHMEALKFFQVDYCWFSWMQNDAMDRCFLGDVLFWSGHVVMSLSRAWCAWGRLLETSQTNWSDRSALEILELQHVAMLGHSLSLSE